MVVQPHYLEKSTLDLGKLFSLIGSYHSFLDPQKAIPTEHIKKAAERAGIKSEDLSEEIKKLSEYLGWDITKGSGK